MQIIDIVINYKHHIWSKNIILFALVRQKFLDIAR